MVQFDPLLHLPTSDELPDSDDTPVDNELQYLLPSLLKLILAFIWANRYDWFFGADMGVYHTTGANPRIPIVPDGFLSLGVERIKGGKYRRSYVVWEEDNVAPIFVLEVVSHQYGGEYDDKISKYARLGVLYYAIYNPDYWKRDKHQPFEVYQLVDETYVLQPGEPLWMPEIGLGIGRGIGTYCGWQREWLYWYDREGNRFSTPEERFEQEQQRAEQEQQRAEQERQRAEQERQRAEQAERQLEQERQQAKQALRDAIAQLSSLGLSVEQIAGALALSVQDVKQVIDD